MKRLPDSELELMMIIWETKGPITRMEIEDRIEKGRKLMPATILSFLSRLEEKGFVKREKKGKLNYYEPIIRKKDYLEQESKTILEKMYGNSVKKLVAALYDGKGIDKRQMEELKTYLDDITESKEK